MSQLIVPEIIEKKIIVIRGQKVMLDSHLAELYGVTIKNLNRAVKRHASRFPMDFGFQLTRGEFENLRCQIGTSSSYGGRRYLPYVFTELGVPMLSTVLNSERAIQVNMMIMRVFVRLREILATHKELAEKLEKLEEKYDGQFRVVFDAIRQLMEPVPAKPKPQIGFVPGRQARKEGVEKSSKGSDNRRKFDRKSQYHPQTTEIRRGV